MIIVYYLCCKIHLHAAMAQSVERRLGKAEVGGSSPLGSPMKLRGDCVRTQSLFA